MAPSDAIISVPGARDDRYEEEEYLVDRRILKGPRSRVPFSNYKLKLGFGSSEAASMPG
jgi:hypothetical protein